MKGEEDFWSVFEKMLSGRCASNLFTLKNARTVFFTDRL